MAFVDVPYTPDGAASAPFYIRVSEEEAAAVLPGTAVAGEAIHVYSSGSRRRFGVHARSFNLARVRGAAPNQFKESRRISVPTIAEWEGAAIGDDVVVAGVTWVIARKVKETRV